DEILRVAARHERQKEHEIHLVGQLHRRAGKQRHRNSRCVLAQRFRDLVRLRRSVERGPDQDPASARGLRFPPDARRLHAVGPYWIDENEQPLTMKTHVVPSSSAWASKAYVEIGRASCRERVEIWGDALSLQEHDR